MIKYLREREREYEFEKLIKPCSCGSIDIKMFEEIWIEHMHSVQNVVRFWVQCNKCESYTGHITLKAAVDDWDNREEVSKGKIRLYP